MFRFLSLLFLVFLSACSENKAPGVNDATSRVPVGAPQSAAPATYLEGVYATSTAPGSDVRNLFDNDAATTWQTQQGAGPDEGIMLYFANPIDLSAVEIRPQPGSFVGNDAQIQAYINGQAGPAGAPGTRLAIDTKPVRSLYFRIIFTGKEVETSKKDGDTEIVNAQFPADASVQLQDIMVYDGQGQPLRIVPPTRIAGTVAASTTLAPQTAYTAANLFDARKEFVWVEGNTATAGEGESLTFSFQQPVNISAIRIWNGYQRSKEHFMANTRVKDFTFNASGEAARAYTLGDYTNGQRIELSPATKGTQFTLTTKSVYPGKRYKDLAISDIVFYDGDQPFVLSAAAGMPAVATTSALTTVLNRRIQNTINTPGDNTVMQSLLLRADGTFVMYNTMLWGTDSQDETIADGNWELLSGGAAVAKVKVFGKWFDMSEAPEYYKGTTQKEVTRIFNEVLTIDEKMITGTKSIGTFYR